MSDKSFVTMERQRCLACGVDFDTGSLLLDKRLRQQFGRHTVTGWGLCGEHRRDGFVTLIGCHAASVQGDRVHDPASAARTGKIAMVKSEVWSRLFNVPVPPGNVCFVEDSVIDFLEARRAPTDTPGGITP